jgi:hypothetical protein
MEATWKKRGNAVRGFIMIALAGGQIAAAAAPARAAEIDDRQASGQRQFGAFAGARLRMPLGGNESGKARAGLALAPTVHSLRSDGSLRTRFGEGMELGLTDRKNPRLSLAGTPVSQLAAGRQGPEGQKLGVSPVGWVAIGLGAVVLLVAVLALSCSPTSECIDDDT